VAVKLVLLQRLSALVFLVAYVVHAHFVASSAPPWVHVVLLLSIVTSGALHLGTSLFFVGTDYLGSRRATWTFGALAVIGSLVGALWPGIGVVGAAGSAPTPAHVAGSGCAQCHASDGADHPRFSLDPHTEAAIGCEQCHDVVEGIQPALARAQPETGSPCVACHDDVRGGWAAPPRVASSAPATSAPAGEPVASAEPPVVRSPPKLCAWPADEVERGLEEAQPTSIEVVSGDASKLNAGVATVELRAALVRERLAVRAIWRDPTHDGEDRIALMLSPLGASAGFDKSGCALTCHATDAVIHRAAEGMAWEWDVTERAARARHLTTAGYRLAPPTAIVGHMERRPEGWTAELALPLAPAFLSAGAASMSVAVFDREPKAHATKTKPIVVDLRCERP
jgi:hypothetical protein